MRRWGGVRGWGEWVGERGARGERVGDLVGGLLGRTERVC